MHALIEADGLSRKFGKVEALTELTLTLPAGQPVAILGPKAPARPPSSAWWPRSFSPTAGR